MDGKKFNHNNNNTKLAPFSMSTSQMNLHAQSPNLVLRSSSDSNLLRQSLHQKKSMEQSTRAGASKVAYQVKPFHKKRIENFLQRPDISKYFAPEDEQDEERETRTKTINLGQLTDALFSIHI